MFDQWYRRAFQVIVAVSVLMSAGAQVSGQIRVLNYNTHNGGPASSGDSNFRTVFTAIGNDSTAGFAKRIDLLAVQEQSATSAGNIAAMMNSLYGVTSYQSFLDRWTTDQKLGFVYDSSKLTLLDWTEVTAGYRPGLRAHFRPVGYTSPEAEFYIYSVHLKAGDYADTRGPEAARIRQDGNNLGDGKHIIYAGDFNLTEGSSEAAYQNMLAAGNGQAFDPLNGQWNTAAKTWNSSSPTVRFDFQFNTGEFTDGMGLSLVTGSYHAFNNSTYHAALVGASDHLPVVADYQVPAKMNVTVGTLPSAVIKGAGLSATVTVSNSAAVVAANGADKLNYSLAGSGVITGSVQGTDYALGSVNTHSLPMNTALPGRQSGQINVSSTSQGVENGHYSSNVSIDILDHATASFRSDSEQRSQTLDLGLVGENTGRHVVTFAIFNLSATPIYTAGLDLNAIVSRGDTGAIGTDLNSFVNLPAGSGKSFTVGLGTQQIGLFSLTCELTVSDQILPGGISGTPLILTVKGQVCASGDANGDKKVDVSDLGILAANYGLTGGATWEQGDFNGDGKVDVSDLGILAASYGSGTRASSDFKTDAKALGLLVDGNQAIEKEATPVTPTLGCGSVGLPLIAGLLLAGIMLSGLKMKN